MRTKDLTVGERLVTDRRRRGQSQDEAAARMGASRYRYRKWEVDQNDEQTPAGPPLGALKPHEACHLRRRRAGVSLADLAALVGVSRWWLCQMEGGEVAGDRLVEFWKNRPEEITVR